ncbi:beta strand repeat-containing protein [Nostoc sp. PA-18-2419]|uniref:beta strand repeat-containing protein n=1 Tax=Nostoc sp. PA-18-2419 TaxID=2575443 RepID=UPI001109881E|nr:calcium-binding protein [Nostoc sp. PA-18-2419]
MANIIGTNANDTLLGTDSADTINGKAGNDIITAGYGDDTLTGGGGKDTFVYNLDDGTDTITDFGGVGKDTNPTAAVIAEVDTIKFLGYGLTARSMLLTQNGNNLEITFEENNYTKVILKNFKLEDLDNLKANGTRPAIGNILFNEETNITDSFNVLDANSTDTSIGIKNTVTFFNDLDNNITALDNSDDVINGQGGNDKIDGLSGDDVLRGGSGNNTLIGGVGNDSLEAFYSSGNNVLTGDAGDDYLDISYSTGNNNVSGQDGDDYFQADKVQGSNILNGGDGNDRFVLSAPDTAPSSLATQTLDGGTGDDYLTIYCFNAPEAITTTFNPATNTGSITAGTYQVNYKNIEELEIRGTTFGDLIVGSNGNDNLFGGSSGIDSSYGNDTIFGGVGYDYLSVEYSTSDNILNGGVDNDNLNADSSTGNNTLNGDAGNDELSANSSKGNNLLNGGDGDDALSASGDNFNGSIASGNNTLNGGTGDDSLSAYDSIGNNLLNGGDGNDSLSVTNNGEVTVGNNVLNGGNGNDSLYLGFSSSSLVAQQTVDGGTGDDLLSIDGYYNSTGGITSTFNAATNTGSIAVGMNRVSYKNIERLNISSSTEYNDYIVGSNGNDTISGGYGGNDTIDGGKGDDLLTISYYTGRITSTFNATTNTGSITLGTNRVSYKNIERLNISSTDDYNDYIVGSNGNDTISGGYGGNDTIDGGKGDDLLNIYGYYNGPGGITSTFNATTNTGSITAGTNRVSYKNIEQLNISGSSNDDLIVGSNGNDFLNGAGSGNDTLNGGAGDDTLNGDNYSSDNNLLYGGDGNDSLSASGSVFIYRDDANVTYASGNNTLNGGAGNDNLVTNFSTGNNLLSGGDGNDSLFAYDPDSLYSLYGVYAVSGNNTLSGGTGGDYLNVSNSSGNNLLDGGDGNDILTASGGFGKNTLKGGNGNDTLTGGKGSDSLYGGGGTDTFVFSSFNEGVDRLYDFNATNEVIQVSATGFGGGLSAGVLKTSEFTIGASATTSTQRLIYNSTTGALFFDSDGSAGAFTQIQFAQLSTGLSLTNNNFVIV